MLITTDEQRRAALADSPPFSVRPEPSADRRVPQYVVWNREHDCAATDPTLSRAEAFEAMRRLNEAWRRRRSRYERGD
jgi:hypothetical protein